jgi:hypothetical protein
MIRGQRSKAFSIIWLTQILSSESRSVTRMSETCTSWFSRFF